MEPPPGSVPHPIGQGLAVAVRVRPGRARMVLVLGIVLVLLYLVLAVLLVLGSQQAPVITVLLLLLIPLMVFQLALVLGQAAVMRGPMLVVDDAGIRTRDLVGWVQVPWSTLRELSVGSGGRVLELEAPSGVYLNEKLMRRSRHRFRLAGLAVQPEHLVTYLQHRRSLTRQAVPR